MMAERRRADEADRGRVGPERMSAVRSWTTAELITGDANGLSDLQHRSRWDVWPYPPPAYRFTMETCDTRRGQGRYREASDDGL